MAGVMISHPTVERLLTEHGNTAAGRRAARTALEEHLVAAAHQAAQHAAQHAARSLRCAQGDHRRMVPLGGIDYVVGCWNDGSTCICECHDPREATP